MPEDSEWYELVDSADLEQGDVLLQCPMYGIDHPDQLGFEGDGIPVRVRLLDVVVMSQTCDLVHDKVTEVLLAEVVAYTQLLNGTDWQTEPPGTILNRERTAIGQGQVVAM